MIPGHRDFRLVGKGGFSSVYTAYQEAFDRQVAVKVVEVELSDDTLRRFRRELATVGRLDGHPHVVRVYESGFDDEDHPYLTMEYHPGGSLADRVQRDGPLPVPEVLDIGVKLACALAAAHDRGILHRDIKPQNVLLSSFHGPVLADFGIAAFDGGTNRTLTGEAFSALHVAPEVLDGHPPTRAADIYSLVSTLYELLAGSAPFASGSEDGLLALMRRVRTQAVPPIERPDVPARLQEELRTGLDRAPERRPASAEALAQRLRDLQAELGFAATPLVAMPAIVGVPPVPNDSVARTTPPDPGPGRRRRWVTVAGAVAAIAVGITAVVWSARDDGDAGAGRGPETTTSERPAPSSEAPATTAADPPGTASAAGPATADGKADRIYVEADGTPAFFANVDGATNSWGARQVIGEGWHPERTLFADLDGDGKDDRIYVAIDGTATYFGNLDARRNAWRPGQVIGQGWDPARIQFADLDGDGKDDWLSLGEDAVLRYHQNLDGPSGSWGPAKEVSFGWDASRIKFADIDGDGQDDQVAVWGDGDASFWVNVDLPNKVQEAEQPLGTGWDPARVQFADVDGDGRDDLIEVTIDGVTRFLANADGTGAWGPAVELGTDWDPARLKFADLG